MADKDAETLVLEEVDRWFRAVLRKDKLQPHEMKLFRAVAEWRHRLETGITIPRAPKTVTIHPPAGDEDMGSPIIFGRAPPSAPKEPSISGTRLRTDLVTTKAPPRTPKIPAQELRYLLRMSVAPPPPPSKKKNTG